MDNVGVHKFARGAAKVEDVKTPALVIDKIWRRSGLEAVRGIMLYLLSVERDYEGLRAVIEFVIGELGGGGDTGGSYYDHGGTGLYETTWETEGEAACRGHVLKYIWRAGEKPEVPAVIDLGKGLNWLNFIIRKTAK